MAPQTVGRNGTLLGDEKKPAVHTHNKVTESQNHYARGTEPDEKKNNCMLSFVHKPRKFEVTCSDRAGTSGC